MTAAYPKRQTHFAHKLVRLMLHSCAAQEIGADGFLVVAAIAHAEDAKRYSGPVTYWNEQLLPDSWRGVVARVAHRRDRDGRGG